jgi:hypothetical protein
MDKKTLLTIGVLAALAGGYLYATNNQNGSNNSNNQNNGGGNNNASPQQPQSRLQKVLAQLPTYLGYVKTLINSFIQALPEADRNKLLDLMEKKQNKQAWNNTDIGNSNSLISKYAWYKTVNNIYLKVPEKLIVPQTV